jgi:hypothetical protein
MFTSAKTLHSALLQHPQLIGYGHAPATRAACVVTLPAFYNGFCIWRATHCVALCGLYLANAPMGGYRLFTSASAAANHMATP